MNKNCLVFFLTVIVAVTFCSTGLSHAGGFGSYGGDGNNLDLSQLEVGDIILTKEAIANSQAIIPGYWDHCAIYVGNSLLIEAWAEGVRARHVDITLTASAAAIYRVDATDEAKQAAVDFCIDQLGKPYDIGLAFWPGTKNENSSAWYCSELIWGAYLHQGIDTDDTPGYSWTYWLNVAPTELADDNDTFYITSSE